MIRFICGTYGSGKTTKILNNILDDIANEKKVFLIVPDQEALQFERLTLSILPPSAQLNLEILSFSRLYNRVCRELGGIEYSYIKPSIRSLMMWKTLHNKSGMLSVYKNLSNDIHSSDMMIETIKRRQN